MSAHSEPSSDLPLAGRTVVVTRPRARAGPFETLLRDRGARVVSFPTIRIAPLEDDSRLREALERLSEHDWLVFTSVNAVEAVAPLLPSGATLPAAGAVRIAAIGPATAAAVRDRLGAEVEAVPAEYRAEALVEAILEAAGDVSGLSFLLPRAAEAREALPRMLEEAGAHVLEVAAYRTLAADDREAGALRNDLAAGRIDWVTFTASSTVRGFTEAVGTDLGPSRVAAIGPITAATARSLGLEVDVVAEAYTIPGLLQALVDAERNGSDVTGRGG
ncbi:MAG TPA: uroporphyrinogen-III synthase [Gemmatimonadota bacterium]|nr:uroporphyrinogen-III synthase [Gemmatimonadota bacterium]